MVASNAHSKAEHQEILLESGTNEVEILEFLMQGQSFGVNVAKIKQIVQFEPHKRNAVPEAPEALMGVYLHRDNTVPLVRLSQALKMKPTDEVTEKPLVMICEFNQIVCGFYIDGVKRIHRLSWKDIQPINEMLAQRSSCIISSVNIDKREVLIVDLEHIIFDIGIVEAKAVEAPAEMSVNEKQIRIILAEDSNFIRNQMITYLTAAGYPNVEDYPDGQKAYDAIRRHLKQAVDENRPIDEFVNFIITDIEMPQMDGLTLCKKIKEEPALNGVPVTIYSSLINEQMQIKCEQVGADYHLCKPQLGDLMKMIHKHMQSL